MSDRRFCNAVAAHGDNLDMPRWILCAALAASQAVGSSAPRLQAEDDRLVIEAMFAHTVQPEADRWTRGPRPLKILSQTVAPCSGPGSIGCFPEASLAVLRPPKRAPSLSYNDSTGPEPGELMPDEAVRLELIASATERNRERRPLPMAASPAITLVPMAEEELVVRDRDTARYAGFSLPGYTKDGHAVVYSFYACGGRCGKSWLFLLERAGSEWRVRARYMLAIR